MPKKSSSKTRQKRKRRLTADEVKLLANLIKDVSTEQALTWESIVDLATRQLGYTWTRQALQAHPEIKNAYSKHGRAYSQFREAGKTPRASAPEIVVLQQKLEKEQAENVANRETLRKYDELLVTYMQNAQKYGISPEQLGAPLVPPFRAQSDGRRVKQKK